MRRLAIIIVVSCVFVLALIGCTSGNQGSSSAVSSSGTASSADAPMEVGGWTLPKEAATTLSADELAIFQDAEKSLDAAIEPVALLGTQLVSGMNYAFLGLGEQGSEAAGWNVVVCYKDLQGNVMLTSSNAIDLASPAIVESKKDDSAGKMVGAWEINVPEKTASLPADAQAAFDAAFQGYTGFSLTPVALLGTQVVSGTNYLMLCTGAPVVPDGKASLYLVKVYEDLDGKAEISSIDELDFLKYIGN